MSLTTSKNYTVHYYEIDAKKRALISTIINYLMDVCTYQSDLNNVGIDYLLFQNRGWILTQWNIKINRYPTYGEEVKVSTTSNSFYKYYAYRKNFIEDLEGNLLVDGTSNWLLVDTIKRRPVRLGEEMFKAFNITPEENERFKSANLPHLESWDNEVKFNVRYSDIDTNEHVNNVKYISWIIESVPLDIALNYEMKEITVVYKKETGYGHMIDVRTEIEKENDTYVCIHNIVNDAGEDLTVAKTIWK